MMNTQSITVILFQIVLCLLVKCVGISIIWCALMGWILIEKGKVNRAICSINFPNLALVDWQNIILSIDLLAICYYSVVAGPITTVAHM